MFCPTHVGSAPIPARLQKAADGEPQAFDAGELVRVRTEERLSVIVLPTDGRAANCDTSADMPDVSACCVPIALVRTPAAEHGVLRWVEIADLVRAETAGP